jgi:hypothetical protein
MKTVANKTHNIVKSYEEDENDKASANTRQPSYKSECKLAEFIGAVNHLSIFLGGGCSGGS